MMMHPEIQRKAQAEIDRVVGSDRFPTFADQADLPYVDAVVKEVLRWKPVAPLGEYTGDVVICHTIVSGIDCKVTYQEYHTSRPRTTLTRDISSLKDPW